MFKFFQFLQYIEHLIMSAWDIQLCMDNLSFEVVFSRLWKVHFVYEYFFCERADAMDALWCLD